MRIRDIIINGKNLICSVEICIFCLFQSGSGEFSPREQHPFIEQSFIAMYFTLSLNYLHYLHYHDINEADVDIKVVKPAPHNRLTTFLFTQTFVPLSL